MSANDRIAILVHEVRSPVAALAAVAEALRDAHGSPAARTELVQLAIGACSAIERIVTDVTVASVRLATVDTADLVRRAVAAHAVAGVDVEARVDPDVPRIECDPVRLRQALDNLIENAVLHGGDRSVAVRATHADALVSISVSDGGAGIPDDDLERIFERGVRLDERHPGSGLGLAIARAIVEAHGGTLRVKSSSAGSTFTITLPVGRSQSDT